MRCRKGTQIRVGGIAVVKGVKVIRKVKVRTADRLSKETIESDLSFILEGPTLIQSHWSGQKAWSLRCCACWRRVLKGDKRKTLSKRLQSRRLFLRKISQCSIEAGMPTMSRPIKVEIDVALVRISPV